MPSPVYDNDSHPLPKGEGNLHRKDSIDVFIRVNKEEIYLLCPYFEAFEGMVSIRTPKPEPGEQATIKLMVSPDFKADFDRLLDNLKRSVSFEKLA